MTNLSLANQRMPSNRFYSEPKDPVVKVWRPSPHDNKPPINPSPKDCAQCKAESKAKEPHNLLHGTADEWLEQLVAKQDVAQIKDWWAMVAQIRWSREDDLRLCKAYLYTLANMVSMETWGRKISRRRFEDLETYMPNKTRAPADEDWFRRNKHRIP